MVAFKVWSKWVKKIVGQNKMWVHKKIGTKNNLNQKKIWVQKNLRQTQYLVQKSKCSCSCGCLQSLFKIGPDRELCRQDKCGPDNCHLNIWNLL